MKREDYVAYLRQQASALSFLAECIEEHGDAEIYAWRVDMPIVTKFDEEIAVAEKDAAA